MVHIVSHNAKPNGCKSICKHTFCKSQRIRVGLPVKAPNFLFSDKIIVLACQSPCFYTYLNIPCTFLPKLGSRYLQLRLFLNKKQEY